MPKRIVDQYTDRKDLTGKQKFLLRHPGYDAERCRKWRQRNPDKHALIQRNWRLKNPDAAEVIQNRARIKLKLKKIDRAQSQVRFEVLNGKSGMSIGKRREIDRLYQRGKDVSMLRS